MNNDIFSRIKAALPMREVADHYGFEVNRSGDMLCPFHADTHPSLHCYPGSRGWYCFVCGTGGDVIDFVAKLFHITVRQAAIRLDNDFRLGLTMERPDRSAVNRWQEGHRRKISIHAPAQGATPQCGQAGAHSCVFQSTLPRRERPLPPQS